MQKAISFDETRELAIKSLKEILEDSVIAGTENNKEFLVEVLAREDFISKPMGTPWLAKNLEDIQASLIAKKEIVESKYSELCEKLVDTVISEDNFTSNLQKRTADVFSRETLLMIQS